jgi:SAM-dependent methyltransferase
MIFTQIASNINISDAAFDEVYPDKIREVSAIQFTPFKVAKKAARFLTNGKAVKVLDIGSGVGKFCLIGSACTKGHFTGVEQRKSLHLVAKRVAKKFELTNLTFINDNIMNIDFMNYEAFYLFNPFFENISLLGTKNKEVEYKREFFILYSMYVNEQLDKMPIGTKLVSYYSFGQEIPDSYELKGTAIEGKMKMWIKIS